MSQVILAEDETQLRGLVAAMLTTKGVTESKAPDGVEALQLVKKQPDAALLLSDIVMHNMDGYELVEASLKLRPELKVPLMKAYTADRPPPSALRVREIRPLVEPFDPDRMCDLIVDMPSSP